MSTYSSMMDQYDLIPPSRFETTVRIMCAVASVVAIGWAGAWTALWTFPILLALNFSCELLKRLYWKGFDPFIQRGAMHGNFLCVLVWNALTVILDWALSCVAPVVCAYLLCAFTADRALAPFFKWLFLWVCVCPPFMFPLRRASLHAQLFAIVLRVVPALPLALSLFFPVTGTWVLICYALVGIPVIGFVCHCRLPEWMREFDKWYDAAHADTAAAPQPPPVSSQKVWFPREGVVFEPRLTGDLWQKLDEGTREAMRRCLIILHVNWTGFALSLAMLIVGAVLACIYANSLWLLLVPPCAFVGRCIEFCITDFDRKRKCDEYEFRFVFLLIQCALVGGLVLWLGGHDLPCLIAAGVFIPASVMFFVGFAVFEATEGVHDTLDYIFLVLGIAAMVACRCALGCLWWESLLPLVVSAGAPGLIRVRWPRRDLRFVATDEPPLLDNKLAEKKARRERKRQRQIAAVRRSQRR